MAKKGQGATEYLIILAVVVIIALIVVSVLGGIPGIGKSSTKQASQAYWTTTDIGISEYYLSAATDSLVLTLRNNQDSTITINNVSVAGIVNASATMILSPGQTGVTSIAKTCASTGDPFEFDNVLIKYTDSSTSADYTFAGTVSLSGECAA